MRDESYLDYDVDASDAPAARPSRWAAAIGAVASVALLAGVVAWSYRLGVRDANDVPVIRAVAGPTKVQPEDAGGAQFAHQGRAVYDLMSGTPDATADAQLAPAPETLAAEDVPAETPAPSARPPEASAPVATADAAAVAPAPVSASEIDALVSEVISRTPTGAAPERSPPAPPRPHADTKADGPTTATVSPAAPIAPTGFEVQLGAYLSEAEAQRQWDGFTARNGDLLAGRAPAISPLESDGRTLYRLRTAAFSDVDDARETCAALLSRGEQCLVIGTR
jgi:cell division septation protein DedD